MTSRWVQKRMVQEETRRKNKYEENQTLMDLYAVTWEQQSRSARSTKPLQTFDESSQN